MSFTSRLQAPETRRSPLVRQPYSNSWVLCFQLSGRSLGDIVDPRLLLTASTFISKASLQANPHVLSPLIDFRPCFSTLTPDSWMAQPASVLPQHRVATMMDLGGLTPHDAPNMMLVDCSDRHTASTKLEGHIEVD